MSPSTVAGWQRLLAELKRRQVFRVAAVYGATAFVVIQVADLVFPRIGLPDWTVTLVVALALLAFPIALGLAWVFESGAEGVRRTTPAAHGELDAIVAQPRSRRWPAGIAAFIGIVLLALGAWRAIGRGDARSYDSIAVLPFVNLSGQPEDEYFGDGLAEELINALASIEGLRVPARTSSFAFKGTNTDARVIGDTLNVDAVLESTVNRGADRIRITVRLIDTRTGYRVWSQPYDRPLSELFTVQQAMAAEIVDALELRLAGNEKKELYRGGTKDVEAYDLYLKGRQKWATRQRDLVREAILHFEAAIARDSSFALAWSGLADAIDALAYRSPQFRARVSEAKNAALQAILLEPELAEGWASLGVLVADYEWNWRIAERALRRAIALKPGYAQAHSWLSDTFLQLGQIREAVDFSGRAAQLDPIGVRVLTSHAQALAVAGRTTEARNQYLHAYTLGTAGQRPGMSGMVVYAKRLEFSEEQAAEFAGELAAFTGYGKDDMIMVGRAVLVPGLRGEAQAALRRMEANGGVQFRDLALFSAAIGDYDRALQLLERSLELREGIYHYGIEPLFDPVRQDARFLRLLNGLGMPNCDSACRASAAAGP